MINIISEENDKSTDNIVRWLVHYNHTFYRFNVENYTSFTYLLGGEKIKTKLNVLHRRAKLQTYLNTGNDILDRYVKDETNMLLKGWEKICKSHKLVNFIGGFNEEDQHNKLYDLFLAETLGLNIPRTLITNSKSDLLAFIDQHKVITKSIRKPIGMDLEDISIYDCGTIVLDIEIVDELDDKFSLSFFQEYIEKTCEIRVMVYGNKIFSMAIFSQNDIKTKIDYRNYNDEFPNRCVPFALPKRIEKKVLKFFKVKNINMGSIDMILKDNSFYFLENNPQGQYDWVSENCNYYIDRYIANNLIKFENEK